MEMMYDREICIINKSIYITMEKGFHRSDIDLFEAKYDSIYFMAMQ